MIHFLILALAVIALGDPVADAVGDGTLAPPTAPVYASTANFDVQDVTLTEDADLTLRVTMGALDNSAGLVNGFSDAVIEVYLDSASGGAEELLPGSGMRMPTGTGWEYAVRLTGDETYLVQAQDEGDVSAWPVTPLTVTTEGTTLVATAAVPRPRHADLYAITGVYDAFGQQPWRSIARTLSPWAFSSPEQVLPVVDVLATTQTEQVRALRTGVLPRYRSPTYGIGWLILMLAGVAAAAVGLVFRRRAGRSRARSSDAVPVPVEAPSVAPVATAAHGGSRGGSRGGSSDGSRGGSMWGEGSTDLPVPRPYAPGTSGTSGGAGTAAPSAWVPLQDTGEASDRSGGTANVGPDVGAGPSSLTVPTYRVRVTETASRPPAKEEAATGLDAAAAAEHGAGASEEPGRERAAEAASDAARESATDGTDDGADAPAVASDAAPQSLDPAERAVRRPPVPIVPLPDGPPRRKPQPDRPPDAAVVSPNADETAEMPDRAKPDTAEPAAADTRSEALSEAVPEAVSEAAAEATPARRLEPKPPDGWQRVLVDPNDTFLEDAGPDPESDALWPTARVRQRERTPEGDVPPIDNTPNETKPIDAARNETKPLGTTPNEAAPNDTAPKKDALAEATPSEAASVASEAGPDEPPEDTKT